MNKRATGSVYEKRAEEYLCRNHYRILQRNFRCRQGEIDLIARDPADNCLVFLEIKFRQTMKAGLPEEAVTPAKQRTISRVALFYLVRYQISMESPMRFDVIAFEGESLRHYKNAFSYCR